MTKEQCYTSETSEIMKDFPRTKVIILEGSYFHLDHEHQHRLKNGCT